MKRLFAIAAAIGFVLALPASAQTKWDLATAYPANNFHTENIGQFVTDVDKASGECFRIYEDSYAFPMITAYPICPLGENAMFQFCASA